MEVDDQDGGGDVVQPIRELGGLARATHADCVEEGPGRARDGVDHEGLDVFWDDLAVESVDSQLLQLRHGQLALPPAIDISLANVGADPLRQQCGCRGSDADAALNGTVGDPARHSLTVWGPELADVAACRGHCVSQRLQRSGAAGRAIDQVQERQTVAICH